MTDTEHAEDAVCYARPERSDPSTLRCDFCRLAWSIDEPIPPGCRALAEGVQARPHDYNGSDGYQRVS